MWEGVEKRREEKRREEKRREEKRREEKRREEKRREEGKRAGRRETETCGLVHRHATPPSISLLTPSLQ